ncbi:MAG TPA: amidohydrolase family protein, partial [Chitinophagaceae bacterium]|nr:amidohydrolase family protein [Chitinophagaceae bacterium]
CHLELSHLKGIVPENTGLVQFLVEVTQFRDEVDPSKVSAAMAAADQEMLQSGIVAVGDVCNTFNSAEQKHRSSLYYHSFTEVLGFSDSNARERLAQILELRDRYRDRGLPATVSPHAPYSVSASLFRLIGSLDETGPVSVHNQECMEEENLFGGDLRSFQEIYDALHIDRSSFRPTGKSSLQSWLPLVEQPQKLLLVHNTCTTVEDLRFSRETLHELYWCLCPNANLYIEGRLPDVPLLRQSGCRMVLGTDSLSSNHRLSILEEMKTIRNYFPDIPPSELLTWATENGARAIGAGHLGSFSPGKLPGVILLGGSDPSRLNQDTTVTRIL